MAPQLRGRGRDVRHAVRRRLAVSTFLFAAASGARAQSAPQGPQPSPARRSADSLLQAKRYAEALQSFEKLTVAEPDRSGHWFQLGMAAYGVERFDVAARAFERANAMQRDPRAQYNAAAMYARMKDAAQAFRWLDSAVANRAIMPEQIEQDADFAAVKSDPRFAAAVDRARRQVTPCMYNPEFRRFDFWVGEWDVRARNGQPVGTSVVERVSGGCGLLENWTPGRGGPGGKSLNTYNAPLKQWQQFWVGPGGGVTEYRKGEWKDSSLVYQSEFSGQKGEAVVLRLTFTPLAGGVVRQFAEQQVNGGAWTTQYEFFYHPRR